MKKVVMVVLLAATASLFGTSYHADEGQMSLTVDELCATAVENSRQRLLDQKRVSSLEETLEDTRQDVERLMVAHNERYLPNIIDKEVLPLNAETELVVAERNMQHNIDSLKTQVRITVLDILLAEKVLENERERLKTAQSKYEDTVLKLENGLVSETHAQDIKYLADNVKLSVKQAENTLYSLDLELKGIIGMPIDGDRINVTGSIEYKPYGSMSVDVIADIAMKNDTGVYSCERKLLAARIALEKTAQFYTEENSEYEDALFEVMIAEKELEDTKAALETDIRNMYNDLQTLRDRVELAKARLNITEKKLEAARVRYLNGMTGMSEYRDAQQQYRDDALGVVKAQHAYMCKKTAFSKWTG